MKNYYIIIFIVALVLLGAGVYYFYFYPSLREISDSALDSHRKGDFQKAAKEFNRALPLAKTKLSEAVLKLYIASAHLGFDRPKGIALLKEVAANTSYPSLQRAFAVQFIADNFMLGRRNLDFAKENIFTGEPYSLFLSVDQALSETSRIYQGIRNIYEYALSLYPLPVAEYRIADGELRAVLQYRIGNPLVTLSKSEDSYIKSAKEHLEKGNEALSNFISAVGSGDDSQIGYAYWLKGAVLGYLAELEENQKYLPEAEEAFKNSLALLQKDNASIYEQNLSLWASFYYASFLERAYGKFRISDIRELLTYLGKPKFRSLMFTLYLQRLGRLDRTTYDREAVLALARIDSHFADYLRDLGWEF